MKFAIIENGKISNTAVSDSALAENWIELQDGFGKGDLYENGVFSKPPVDLADHKEQARTRFKQERDEIEAEPVNNFQCSRPQDIIKIEKAIRDFDTLLADEDGKTLWKMADNTYARVTKSQMQELDPLQMIKVAKAYAAEAEALNRLNSATTKEEIDSVSVMAIYETL